MRRLLKFTALLLAAMLVFSLSACMKDETKSDTENSTDSANGDTVTSENANSDTAGTDADTVESTDPPQSETTGDGIMRICVRSNGYEVVFELNDSAAAKSLYAQLPLTIAVENYSNNEKIFYPPQKLDTENAVDADPVVGSLAYFSPWDNVVMYYGGASPYPGLYALGEAISGAENIKNLSGDIEITAYNG